MRTNFISNACGQAKETTHDGQERRSDPRHPTRRCPDHHLGRGSIRTNRLRRPQGHHRRARCTLRRKQAECWPRKRKHGTGGLLEPRNGNVDDPLGTHRRHRLPRRSGRSLAHVRASRR